MFVDLIFTAPGSAWRRIPAWARLLWTLVCASALGLLSATPLLAQGLPTDVPPHSATACAQRLWDMERRDAASLAKTLLKELAEQLPACQNDVDWLSRSGRLLLSAGEPVIAADYIERALMLEPAVFERQLDYALALAASGQQDSAVALIRSLMQEPSMPEQLKGSLSAMLARVQGPSLAREANRWRWSAGLRSGHESNLLGAPNLSELGLNVGGLLVTLPLDPSYLSRSGSYSRSELSVVGNGVTRTSSVVGDIGWQVWGQFAERQSPVTEQAGLRQAASGLELMAGPLWLSFSFTRLSSNAGLSYQASTLAGGLAQTHQMNGWGADLGARCQTRVGPDLQLRNYLSSPTLSGHYAGLLAQWSCELPAARVAPSDAGSESQQTQSQASLASHPGVATSADSWTVALAAGQDRPQNSPRAGGIQDELGLRLAYNKPLAVAGLGLLAPALHFGLDLDRKFDHEAYSSLLGGAQRKVRRTAQRLELSAQHVALPGWRLVTGLQMVRQMSNISLFGMQSNGFYVALSKVWP